MSIRVLIADDDVSLRSSTRFLIENEPGMEVVAEVSDGAQAVEAAGRLQPDVALLDVRMPRMNGLHAARALSDAGSRTRVIVLTMFDLDEYVYEALRVGASGFLLKNAPPSELLRAIRVAAEGNALLAPEVTRRLISRFARVGVQNKTITGMLTERERETLSLIGRGASNDEIAQEMFVTSTTVRTYVNRVLTKLGARDRAQLVVIAYESGLAGPRE